jgi:hypothetical protein
MECPVSMNMGVEAQYLGQVRSGTQLSDSALMGSRVA